MQQQCVCCTLMLSKGRKYMQAEELKKIARKETNPIIRKNLFAIANIFPKDGLPTDLRIKTNLLYIADILPEDALQRKIVLGMTAEILKKKDGHIGARLARLIINRQLLIATDKYPRQLFEKLTALQQSFPKNEKLIEHGKELFFVQLDSLPLSKELKVEPTERIEQDGRIREAYNLFLALQNLRVVVEDLQRIDGVSKDDIKQAAILLQWKHTKKGEITTKNTMGKEVKTPAAVAKTSADLNRDIVTINGEVARLEALKKTLLSVEELVQVTTAVEEKTEENIAEKIDSPKQEEDQFLSYVMTVQRDIMSLEEKIKKQLTQIVVTEDKDSQLQALTELFNNTSDNLKELQQKIESNSSNLDHELSRDLENVQKVRELLTLINAHIESIVAIRSAVTKAENSIQVWKKQLENSPNIASEGQQQILQESTQDISAVAKQINVFITQQKKLLEFVSSPGSDSKDIDLKNYYSQRLEEQVKILMWLREEQDALKSKALAQKNPIPELDNVVQVLNKLRQELNDYFNPQAGLFSRLGSWIKRTYHQIFKSYIFKHAQTVHAVLQSSGEVKDQKGILKILDKVNPNQKKQSQISTANITQPAKAEEKIAEVKEIKQQVEDIRTEVNKLLPGR